jgi:3-oxoacyl-[acyl-carrier protein] reductase
MELGIGGKVALVTASARGLGLAVATRLAMEGCPVAICGRRAEALEAARARILAEVPDATVAARPADLTEGADIERLVSYVRDVLGPVSILVTNSGGPPPGTFDDADDAAWEQAFRLTYLSAVRLIRAVLPDMREQRWGRVINLTSRALKEPIPNLMISNALRLAVGGMAKTLAAEVAPYGITVNNVLPGPTATERQVELIASRARRSGISEADSYAQVVRDIPLGRLAEPEEPAAAAAFLASELAGYITGVSLLVDGGAVRSL